MNFLAHIYLSQQLDDVAIGNFIADQLPNNKFDYFRPDIQIGIRLHRAIDTYTDKHPIVKASKRRLHAKFSHYSGVIVDILYDHFLAKNWSKYHDIPLDRFVQDFYNLLLDNQEIIPEETQRLLPYMIRHNWLLSYAKIEGISDILAQMNRRTKGRSKMHLASLELEAYYDEFESEFTLFFKDLEGFSSETLETLKTQVHD
ncbi:MAG: ACP phosphodiesterase [Flavobacteriales bacterium]